MLKLLTALTGDDSYSEMLREEGGKPKNMCEVLDRVEAKGKEIGKEIGIREGRLSTLTELVRNHNITVELGAKMAGLSVDEFRKEVKL